MDAAHAGAARAPSRFWARLPALPCARQSQDSSLICASMMAKQFCASPTSRVCRRRWSSTFRNSTGRVPIELTGMSPSRRSAADLSLEHCRPMASSGSAGGGSGWSRLAHRAAGTAARFHNMVIRRDLTELVDEPRLAVRCRAISFLPIFPSVVGSAPRAKLCDRPRWCGHPPWASHHNILLGELEVELEGHKDSYLLPLTVAWDETQPSALAQQLSLARIRPGPPRRLPDRRLRHGSHGARYRQRSV